MARFVEALLGSAFERVGRHVGDAGLSPSPAGRERVGVRVGGWRCKALTPALSRKRERE